MELYSYDYALKALWLYTSEPEWASNWSSFERRRASTLIVMLARTGLGEARMGTEKWSLGDYVSINCTALCRVPPSC